MDRRNLPARQRGLGMWGWLGVVAIMLMIGAAALRIVPHYVDFEIVNGVLDRLPVDDVHQKMSREDIREVFSKQFRIEGFKLKVKDILKIERSREQTDIIVDYEIREPLVYNVDLVLKFHNQRTFD